MTDLLDRLKAALADRYTIERELGSGGSNRYRMGPCRSVNYQLGCPRSGIADLQGTLCNYRYAYASQSLLYSKP
jgi:hypothetical protein